MRKLTNISDLKSYDKEAKERGDKLQELEQATAEHLDTIEHHQSVQEHLVELQRQQAALYGERDALRGEWSEASFNGDTEQAH